MNKTSTQIQFNKLQMMIVDDNETTFTWSKTATIQGLSKDVHPERKIKKISEFVDFTTFEVPQEAIVALQNGYRPDIAILDINFLEIKPGKIDESKRHLLATKFGGFEIFDAIKKIHKECVCVIFTNYAADKEIEREAKKRGLKVWDDIILRSHVHGLMYGTVDKAFAEENLEEKMPFFLEKNALNYFKKFNNRQRGEIKKHANKVLSKGSTEKRFLEKKVSVDTHFQEKNYQLKTFLLCYASLNKRPDGSLQVIFDNPAERALNLLEKSVDKDYFILRGHLEKEKEYFDSYWESEAHLAISKKASIQAANLILEAVNKAFVKSWNGHLDYAPGIFRLTHGKRVSNEDFRERFYNLLVYRRAALGLTELAKTNLVDLGGYRENTDRKRKERDIVKYIIWCLKKYEYDFTTEYDFLHMQLGLNFDNTTRMVNTKKPDIMDEEEYFLYGPEFLSRLISKIENKDTSYFF